jgi:hypothetical protein
MSWRTTPSTLAGSSRRFSTSRLCATSAQNAAIAIPLPHLRSVSLRPAAFCGAQSFRSPHLASAAPRFPGRRNSQELGDRPDHQTIDHQCAKGLRLPASLPPLRQPNIWLRSPTGCCAPRPEKVRSPSASCSIAKAVKQVELRITALLVRAPFDEPPRSARQRRRSMNRINRQLILLRIRVAAQSAASAPAQPAADRCDHPRSSRYF